MIRVNLLVEGQTEEAFVNELLQPHYALINVFMKAILVQTSVGHRGGVTSYAKIRPQIERLCKQDPAAFLTTLFDLYALPLDFPGRSSPVYATLKGGEDKAVFIERSISKDIGQRNFIPNLIVHEFEALLLTQVDAFCAWWDTHSLTPLRTVRKTYNPEEINESPRGAPSKRILAVFPNYQKVLHGPLIACDIGLDQIRRECPHFSAWLVKLEKLADGVGP